MKKLRRLLLPGLFALLLSSCSRPGACGTAAETSSFRSVAPHLDRDAAEFAVFSGAHANRVLSGVIAGFEADLWKNPGNPAAPQLQELAALLQMFRKLSGADKMTGIGYSTKTLAPEHYGQVYMHTRIFAAFPLDAPGLLNNFFAGSNGLAPAGWLGNLPVETVFAATFTVTPDVLFRMLKNSGRWGEDLILELAENLPLEELCRTSGNWEFVIFRSTEQQHAAFFIPGSGESLISLLKALFPGAEISAANGKITVYTTLEAKRLCTGKTRRLRDNGNFSIMRRAMPEKAVALLYAAPEFTGKPLPLFTALSRRDDGAMLYVNSDEGVLGNLIRLLLPPPYPAETESLPRPAAPGAAKCDCEELLAELKKIAAGNRDETVQLSRLPQKFFRQKSQPRTLKNCKLIIFSGNPAICAISNPQLHGNNFHVLLKDGTVKSYQLPKADSCRRIISFLHTICRWEENVLQTLLRMAEKFDAELSEK